MSALGNARDVAFPPASPSESDAGQAAIGIHALNHYYGEGELRNQVLFDNHLTVARGEIVIMSGPSGSGKTTLLTLIGTLRNVQEGSLKVLGTELRGASPDELIAMRRRIGFIFQAHNLFESLTAMQNVRMGMELFHFTPREMQDRITNLLTRLDLAERLHYKPGNLSGGQKQRVAIARGLAHRPQLVLADEPTAALDEETGRKVVTLFQEMAREEKTTIVIVTHDNRILDVADRIVNMVDGRIKSNVLVKESAARCQLLKDVPIFANLTPRTLTHTADRMIPEKFLPGAAIVRQGEAGDKFYVIRAGRVRIVQREDGEEKVVGALGKGEFFGEVALMTGAPRNATVIAEEETDVLALSKEDFQEVLAASASFEQELRKVLFERQ